MWKYSDFVFCLEEGRDHFLTFRVKQFPEQYENEGRTGSVLESLLEEMAVCIRLALHLEASHSKAVLCLTGNNEHSNFYFEGNYSGL